MGVIKEYLNPEYSIRKEAALLISLLGTVVSLVSFIATNWAKQDTFQDSNPVTEIGLWRFCRYVDPVEDNREACFSTRELDLPGWFTATQVLCTMGFSLQLATLLLIIVSECIHRCRSNLTLVFAFIGLGVCSALIITPGLILFGAEINSIPLVEQSPLTDANTVTLPEAAHSLRVAWSFHMMALSAFLQPVCALLGVWDAVVKYRAHGHVLMVEDKDEEEYRPYGSMSTALER